MGQRVQVPPAPSSCPQTAVEQSGPGSSGSSGGAPVSATCRWQEAMSAEGSPAVKVKDQTPPACSVVYHIQDHGICPLTRVTSVCSEYPGPSTRSPT
jgi:hypothetical protein